MDRPSFANNQDLTGGRLAGQRVAIIGLGLMGGSLALALRGKVAALLGVDPEPTVRSLALRQGIVDHVAENPAELLPESSLVILAAPVRSIISLIYGLPALHPGRAIIIDLGSTKVEITRAMAALPERLSPVGGHPMCGKETNSLVNASADLYVGAPFVFSALSNSTPDALYLANELAAAIGAKPLWVDPIDHDCWVAATSHLPYLLSNALAACTPLESASLIGPGFRSTARLALSSPRMMLDILITNRENIIASLENYRAQLAILENALATGGYSNLLEFLEQGAFQFSALTATREKERVE